ncbi:MAG: ribosome biogenesis GTPase Der [Bacillota bacterium]|nr:ribosome biogenesis GTPase Der [Bacillota bacterium]MDD3297571.1 ribosome biogenesis GTPase Der [Bacillota bacterium]MDD3850180.1 ribosome biogenesis GTPase Der [Bacillota bacterium]MDD4707276.1 ribosome biogenesis GTPase Der [Bacillota bacterium]
MTKPIVAIVGRPNVGKSTFFNKIAGKRISIVEDTPGITRDRIYADVEWLDHKFTLIDTGGIEFTKNDPMLKQMRAQSRIAIDTADVILFMVDVREGMTSTDHEVAEMLRKTHKPVLLVCNKVDSKKREDDIYEFYDLGLGSPIPISAGQQLGLGDLLDEVVARFPDRKGEEEDGDIIRVAILGKPNVGKSSLLNRILGEERVIVSDVPGTTRDAIDTPFTAGGREYIFIDTAGIRRKSRIDDAIEKYSVIRALTAVTRSDVSILVIDACQGPTEQDTKIAGHIRKEGKACIVVVNKWDLYEKKTGTTEEYKRSIKAKLTFIDYAPVVFVSAKTGQRMDRILDLVDIVAGSAALRVTTGVLNEIIGEATLMNQPPSDKGKRLKIFYGTQFGVKPPSFALFVNDRELMHFSYLRYIENQLREAFGFEGTPVRIVVRERENKGGV